MAKNKKRNRFVSQAALEALIKFGPELSGLKELERQATENYASGVQQARGTRRGTIAAIDRARPEIKKVYAKSGLEEAKTASMVGTDISALSGVAPSIAAGAQVEAAGAVSRLRGARDAALTDLSNERVSARAGEGVAVRQARTEFIDAITKVYNRKQDLAGEKGAFTALTARELRTAAGERADKLKIAGDSNSQSERNSIRSAGINPDTGEPIPGSKKPHSGSGTNGLSPDKHLEYKTGISEIVDAATPYKDKLSRAQIIEKLKSGRSAQTVLVDKDGNPLPEGLSGAEKVAAGAHKVRLPAKTSYKPDLRMSAALDVVQFGHLTRATQRQLQQSGFSVKQLGLPTYGEWKKKNDTAVRRAKRRGKARNKAAGGQLYGPAF